MTSGVEHRHLTRYLDLASIGDRRRVLQLVRELERAGAGPAALLGLVASAQAEAGRRWQLGEWTVAQEHTATSIGDIVVSQLLDRSPLEDRRGVVAVVCADGEWHVLPARMFSHGLESAGWDVHFVGGSVPPEHLHDSLPHMRVDAVVVSCTMSVRLPGAGRTVAAAHAAGLPVLVGGGAFDRDGRRAAAIGADAQASSVEEADRILSGWQDDRPSLLAAQPPTAESVALAGDRERIVSEAYAALEAAFPQMRDYDERRLTRTLEDLGHHVDYLVAALRTDDATIYHDMLSWLGEILEARGHSPITLSTSVDVLRRVLGMLGHREAVLVLGDAAAQGGLGPTADG